MSEKPRITVPVSFQYGVMDSLANLMTGGGTTADRRTAGRWLGSSIYSHIQVEQAYRGSWLMRKIIDLPAYDMTREGRDWQGTDEQIGALEGEEERLCVWEKIRKAIILGRLGGGAIIMGDGADLTLELNPLNVQKGGLKYLFVVPKTMLNPGPLINDPEDDDFGEPETFGLSLPGKPVIDVHRSRVLAFKGRFNGGMSAQLRGAAAFWGDSEVEIVEEAVRNATTAQNEFASLIAEAKIDLYRIPGLMANVGNAAYETKFLRRLELANTGKSIHRALIMDKDEEWEQRQLNLTGMADMIRIYVSICAGASDIPATRLLGKSPDGMNATGDSDQANYEQMIKTKQENELTPILEKLDNVLIPSALGQQADAAVPNAANDKDGDEADEDEALTWEYGPLSVLGESDAAEVENKEALTLKTLFDTGMFQDEALEISFSNRMIQSDRWPGYDAARKKAIKSPKSQPSPRDITGIETPAAPDTGATVVIKTGAAATKGPTGNAPPAPAQNTK